MRLVGLEEHVVTAELLSAWRELPAQRQDLALRPASAAETGRLLLDVGAERLGAMDRTGLDVQVLSLTTPGVQNLDVDRQVTLARHANDVVAAAVAARPERFQGLAALPTATPSAAAEELERAICELGLDGAMLFGRTGETHLDHHRLAPLYELAQRRRVPLHLHPQSPPLAVRTAYYSGFGPQIDAAFATFGVGWHYDAGVEFLRMVLGGVFDRFPELRVIVGHWGELVLFFLERIEHLARAAGLPRSLHDYARTNLIVAPSGILSSRYLRWALEVLGAERIVFSTDYPFEAASHDGAARFLLDADLSDRERHLIASGTWEGLRSGVVR